MSRSRSCRLPMFACDGAEGSIMKLKLALCLLIVFACALVARMLPGGEKSPFAAAPLPAGLLATEKKAGLAAIVCFFEGPAVDAQGNVVFSDIPGDRILKLKP